MSGGETSADGGAPGGNAALGGFRGDGGPELNVLPPYRSGSRLRAITVRAGPDASQWLGWYDSELDSQCNFLEAADGTARCLPISYGYVPGFADAACSEPLWNIQATGGNAVPSRVALVENPCKPEWAAYEVGNKHLAPAYYFDSLHRCVEWPASDGFYELSPLPSNLFVAAAHLDDPRSETLAMSYWKSEDGALQPLYPWDAARQARCTGDSDGTLVQNDCTPDACGKRCVPFRVAPYADCGDGMAYFRQGNCKEPSAVEVLERDHQCLIPPNVRYFEVGAERPDVVIVCSEGEAELESGGVRRHFELGAPIPTESLPRLGQVDLGEGRVVARHDSTPDGVPLQFVEFYDTELGAPCSPVQTSEAGLRCMPFSHGIAGVIDPPQRRVQFGDYSNFANSACTERVFVLTRQPQPGACADLPPPTYFQTAQNEAFKVGPEVTPERLYQHSSSGCEPTPYYADLQRAYRADPIPNTELAEMTRVTE